jgi:hypothetical protein
MGRPLRWPRRKGSGWRRQMRSAPIYLYVGCFTSGDRRARGGWLTPAGRVVATPSPCCLLFSGIEP